MNKSDKSASLLSLLAEKNLKHWLKNGALNCRPLEDRQLITIFR